MAGTPQENAALVRRFRTNGVAGGDTDAVSVFRADGMVDHNLVFGDGRRRGGATALGWRVLVGADVDLPTARELHRPNTSSHDTHHNELARRTVTRTTHPGR